MQHPMQHAHPQHLTTVSRRQSMVGRAPLNVFEGLPRVRPSETRPLPSLMLRSPRGGSGSWDAHAAWCQANCTHPRARMLPNTARCSFRLAASMLEVHARSYRSSADLARRQQYQQRPRPNYPSQQRVSCHSFVGNPSRLPLAWFRWCTVTRPAGQKI